jgi:Flp pilus assembly pilin Flp
MQTENPMFGVFIKILHGEGGFTAIEYGLAAAFGLILIGQLASQFH